MDGGWEVATNLKKGKSTFEGQMARMVGKRGLWSYRVYYTFVPPPNLLLILPLPPSKDPSLILVMSKPGFGTASIFLSVE